MSRETNSRTKSSLVGLLDKWSAEGFLKCGLKIREIHDGLL